MSKLLKPTSNTERNKILQNINCFVSIHDITCCCEEPLKCIVKQIYKQEPNLKFNKQDLQQWFTTTETGEGHGGDVDDIAGEEIDALFAGIEEDTAG